MRKLFVLIAVLFLSACAGVGRESTPQVVYDFGVPAAPIRADHAWSSLALEIRAPYWFDSLSIEYRLAYDDPLRLHNYADSRWAGAPTKLLAQRLRQQLGLASATGNTAADCLLRFDLQEFSQIFDAPAQSRGVLQGGLTLLDAKRRIVAVHPVSIELAAGSADARGGVVALVAASDQLGQQVSDWLGHLDSHDKLKLCRQGVVKMSKS